MSHKWTPFNQLLRGKAEMQLFSLSRCSQTCSGPNVKNIFYFLHKGLSYLHEGPACQALYTAVHSHYTFSPSQEPGGHRSLLRHMLKTLPRLHSSTRAMWPASDPPSLLLTRKTPQGCITDMASSVDVRAKILSRLEHVQNSEFDWSPVTYRIHY